MSAKKHMMALDDELIQQAMTALGVSTIRDSIALAVRDHLPGVLELLLQAGLERRPAVSRRMRTIDNATWAALVKGKEVVPLGPVELVRASLVRAVRSASKESPLMPPT
jgi:Arc/MetJ family transcription regulator